MKIYLNLGCGKRYHKEWTNVDFKSNSDNVIECNLLNGIPFQDCKFEVVYHSHVLEHFTKSEGRKFIEECYRVLKKNGIIRIAVPDLEQIVREYLTNLELALSGNQQSKYNYDWIMLEMYDQVLRNKTGGDMAQYLYQAKIPNEQYVYKRIGEEARMLRNDYLNNINNKKQEHNKNILNKVKVKINSIKKRIIKVICKRNNVDIKYTNIGKFRSSGEIHQWMYDRYSLNKLLTEVGFKNIEIKTVFESNIPNWEKFKLESENQTIYKPDSLIIEAIKK